MKVEPIGSSNRLLSFDIAKGIGIFFVVFGHNDIFHDGNNLKLIYSAIFSFHMPLFFIISGYFFKENPKVSHLLIKRFKTLIYPYFLTLVVIAVLKFFTKFHFAINLFKFDMINICYSANKIGWTPLWFLTSLFITTFVFSIFYISIIKRVDRTYVIAVVVIVWLIMGYYIFKGIKYNYSIIFNKWGGLPWNIDLLPFTLFFYCIGYLFRKNTFILNSNKYIFTLIFVAFIFLSISFDGSMNLNGRVYDHLIISTAKALLGSIAVINFSNIIAENSNKFRIVISYLSKLGKLSLIILIFHLFFELKSYIIFTKILSLNIYLSAFFSFLIGLIGPVLLYTYLLSRNNLLKLVYGNV
jgi:polysaccharide biosynthesis protein PslL